MKTLIAANRSEACLRSVGAKRELEAHNLQDTIKEIGLARFVGRINSGVIPSDVGLEAVEFFVTQREHRPFVSRLVHSVLGRRDSFHVKP